MWIRATAPRSSQQVPHAQFITENVKRINEQKTDSATPQAPMTAVALQPLLYCNHQPLIRVQSTGDPAAHAVGMPLPLGIGNASAWECPSPHDGSFRTECSPFLCGRPLRYSLVILTAYSKNKATELLCDECWLRFPWTNNPRGVRRLFFFIIVTLPLCCCGRCTFSCVCVSSVRGADTTDCSRRMCMRWSLVCRSCLLLPLPSVCWCCGRAVCAAYGACVAAALASFVCLPSVCVCRTSRLPCCSPCPSLCRSAPHH
ncbi:hypothetical protein TCSYLVIO_008540 [Trypanosoma cruzi]|nr:hypothetical protein TCSYLVIO_008540 [Trypanosoma cruzi]